MTIESMNQELKRQNEKCEERSKELLSLEAKVTQQMQTCKENEEKIKSEGLKLRHERVVFEKK